MPFNQNDLDRIADKLQRGEISADEANVLIVRCKGVRLVLNSLPAPVRRALNAAVKDGRLGHLPKDGAKPEAYFHPNSAYRARADRDAHEQLIRSASSAAVDYHSDKLTAKPQENNNDNH